MKWREFYTSCLLGGKHRIFFFSKSKNSFAPFDRCLKVFPSFIVKCTKKIAFFPLERVFYTVLVPVHRALRLTLPSLSVIFCLKV